MPSRRVGPPRLVTWTGERCVPWTSDLQVVYEHYHRYLWARRLLDGRRVLDLGSGEGFGSELLAEVASEVVGLDVDPRAVEHSRLHHQASGLSFELGSAVDLTRFPDDRFDAVVSFEVIEHLEEQEQVLAEVARVLAPDGLLLISTPERAEYSDAHEFSNPYHERELSRPEFEALLSAHFPSVALFGQRPVLGSHIVSLDAPTSSGHLSLEIEREGDEWRAAEAPPPRYLVAVATDGPLPALSADSTLSDAEQVVAVQREIQATHRRREEDREHEASERRRLLADFVHQQGRLEHELETAQARVDQIEGSAFLRLMAAARRRVYGVIGRDTAVARALGALVRSLGSLLDHLRPRPAPQQAPIEVPSLGRPVVSIVIAVAGAASLTERCLRAVVANGATVPYELVLVDNAADADTKALLRAVEGARVVALEQRVDQIEALDKGAGEVAGDYVVFLHNDTQPRAGWLDALLSRSRSAEDVGVVVGTLIGTDGRLLDAGGITWRDGSVWSYGRGGDPSAARGRYVREIDHGPLVAALVRREVLTMTSGLPRDEASRRHEDVALCFRARELGWRVLYEPESVVEHEERADTGFLSDAAPAAQRGPDPAFSARWREALEEQPAGPSAERAHHASDRRHGPSVLVVLPSVPSPELDPDSLRSWTLVEALLALGCRVTVVPDSRGREEPYATYARWLRSMGAEVLDGPSDLEEQLGSMAPQLRLVILSSPEVAAQHMIRIREAAPDAAVAYDSPERSASDAAGELELALVRIADVTLVPAELRQRSIQAAEPGATVEVLPHAPHVVSDPPGADARAGLLFLGRFDRASDRASVTAFAEEVMPRVLAEDKGLLLTVVGADPPAEVTGAQLAGAVTDLAPLLRESLAVAVPVSLEGEEPSGALAARAAGVPVVAIDPSHDPAEQASRLLSLRDPENWERASGEARAAVVQADPRGAQRAVLESLLAGSLSALA